MALWISVSSSRDLYEYQEFKMDDTRADQARDKRETERLGERPEMRVDTETEVRESSPQPADRPTERASERESERSRVSTGKYREQRGEGRRDGIRTLNNQLPNYVWQCSYTIAACQ